MCRHHLAPEPLQWCATVIVSPVSFTIFTICGAFTVASTSAADWGATEPVPQEVRSQNFSRP
jgi:hypothetical protein